jgi:DNA-binding CsgD family transcriptional regulator
MTENAIADAIDVVSKSPLSAVVLELPAERIVAASPTAADLLSQGGGMPVIGRSLEDFTTDDASGGVDLLLSGRINGYETTRAFRGSAGEDVRLHAWVRGIGEGSKHAIAVVWPAPTKPDTLLPAMKGEDVPPLVGSVNADLVVDRVCQGVEEVLGAAPAELLGGSVLRLVEPEDAANLMWAIAQATTSGAGASVRVRLRRAHGESLWCLFLVQPLIPPPSFTFAVLGDGDEEEPAGGPGRAARALWRLGHGMETSAVARDLQRLSDRSGVDLTLLTTRELDVVGRLVAGDRVPAMAKAMYLSQSTIRNHLSAVFRKLRISSQQELLDLLRDRT